MKNTKRLFLLSWVIVPTVLVWLSTNYLIGLNRHTVWETKNNPKENSASPEVLGASDVKEIEPIKWNHEGLITLWFDDAWLSQFSTVFPILNEKEIKGALSVPTGMVGLDSYMSWAQVKFLDRNGWEITSHTRSHSCKPEDLTQNYIESELKGSLDDLKNHGIKADNFVTPCGVNSQLTTDIAKKYYLSLRTTDGGFNPLPVDDMYSLKIHAVGWDTNTADIEKWINEAKGNQAWVIIVFHQVQDEQSQYATTPQKFRDFINLVENSGLKIVLPTQALQLVEDNSVSEKYIKIDEPISGLVNIRSQPDIKSEKVGSVVTGSIYKIEKTENNWYEIKFKNSTDGWVSAQFTKPTVNSTNQS